MALVLSIDKLETKNYATPTKAVEMVFKAFKSFPEHVDLRLDVYIHAQVEAKGIRYYPVIKFRREADLSLYMHAVMSFGFRITL